MTSTREAMALLREANPVPAPEAEAAATTRTPSVPRPRRTARYGLLATATAGAAVAAVALSVLPLPWSHGAATPAAADALDRAASAADITTADQAARPDQYWRVRTVGTYLVGGPDSEGQAAWLQRSTRTDYVAVNGTRPSWTVEGAAKVTEVFSGSAPEGERGRAEAWTSNLAPNDEPGSWQTPNPAWLAALPRDTDALRDRLYADTDGHGRSRDGEVLVYVADVLRSGMVPADVRAALFRVLETVPGVDIVRRHTDGLISIGRLETVDGERQEIVIDPATGFYVGEQSVATNGDATLGIPAGTVIGDAVITTTVVDKVPAKVQDEATRMSCTVSDDGGRSCTSP